MSATMAAIFFAGSTPAELQLTPQTIDRELNGTTSRALRFLEGAQQVTYEPPAGWSYYGTTNVLNLRPPAGLHGAASVSRMPVVAEQHFDEETIKQLSAEVVRSVPSGSQQVNLLSVTRDAVTVAGKSTLLLVVDFDFFGTAQRRSVMFLNRRTDQIRFQLTSPRSDFAQLQSAFLTSHLSWQNL